MKPLVSFLVLFCVIFFVYKIKADPEGSQGNDTNENIDSILCTSFKNPITTEGELFVDNKYESFKETINKAEEKSMSTFYKDLKNYMDKIKPLNEILTLEINTMVSMAKSIYLNVQNNMNIVHQGNALSEAVDGFTETSFLYSNTLMFAKKWIDKRQPHVSDHELSKTLIEIGKKLSGAQHYIDVTRNNVWHNVNTLLELVSKNGKNWQGIEITVNKIKNSRKVSDFVSRAGIAYEKVKNIVEGPNYFSKILGSWTRS